MKVSLNWLRDYLDIALSPDELAERLTLTGTKVEGIERVGAQWSEIFVGQIVRLEPHPDPAVSLQLATLSLGERGTQTVVTGAFNIQIGDKVPYAGVGVTLPNGLTLKPRKLRGVVSEGMVLADDELGLGGDHSGIRILDPSTPEGVSLATLLGDAILDLEITTNRPDCLSVIGVAREVAAITRQPLRLPTITLNEGTAAIDGLLTVRVEVPQLCPRFTARVVTGVTVGPSPAWLVERLRAAGVRSINNVVDITNYVMLEYGQPMHPYDAAHVEGGMLIVRLARPGEHLRTLDEQDRTLTPDMLVIADGADRPIGLAAVMGGASTEISATTTTVALEVANWNAVTVRRTSTRLGLRSEASSRFEKGLPPYLTALAADRAAALMAELAGGTVARGRIDLCADGVVTEVTKPLRWIALPLTEPQRLLGMELDRVAITGALEPLGFTVADGSDTTTVQVGVPAWRADIGEGADLVEEVARMVGYDRIPETLLRGRVVAREPERGLYWWQRLRPFLLACGLSEATTHTLVGDAALERLRAPEALEVGPLSEDELAALIPNATAVTAAGASYGPLRLHNPMTPERALLRPTLMAGLLDSVSLNLRNGAESVRLFELGRCYYPRRFEAPDPSRLPALERRTIGIALGGLREQRSWDAPPLPLDFFDLKGIVESLLAFCGVTTYVVEAAGHPSLHPGRAARLRLTDRRGRPSTELALLGEVHPVIADRFSLRARTLVLELDLDALAAVASAARGFSDLSRYPAVTRDLAVVVAQSTPAAEILRAVHQGGGKLLREVTLFDLYSGEQLGADQKSVALSLVFQSHEATLSERDLDGVFANIQRRLRDTVGATFRA